MKESDLSLTAKQFLLDIGCTEVHGEVADIDLVGKKGNILYSIELKTTLSTKVLEQAYNRKSLVNYSYVAVPHNKCPRHSKLLNQVYYQFLKSNGLGLIRLYPEKSNFSKTYIHYEIIMHPKLNRQKMQNSYIWKQLSEDTLNALGGSTSSERFSPYKAMINQVISFLENYKEFRTNQHKWITIDQLIDYCPKVVKHYANPKASLRAELHRMPSTVEIKKIDNKNYYRYRGDEDVQKIH